MNFSEMSKEELIDYIKELGEQSNGKYGLVWDKEKEPEKIVIDCDKKIPILKEVKNKIIDGKKNNHILIQGDNFHALSVLNYTHKEAIDVIYIDPPYNTGRNDFFYNDSYVDANDGYKHSKWLNFMSKRLKLARELLKDDGVIFISIDYHEYAQLKLLCDSIFSEQNYLETLIQNKGNAQNDAVDVQHNHEYILVYRKKIRTAKVGSKNVVLPTIQRKEIIEKEVEKDENGYFYKTGAFVTGSSPTLNERPNMGWTIYYNPNTDDKIALMDYDVTKARTSNDEKIYKDDKKLLSKGYEIIRAPKKGNKLGRWSWGIELFNENKDNVLITKKSGKWVINVKKYVDSKNVTKINNKYFYNETKYTNSKSIIDFSSAYGTTALNEIMGGTIDFNNPKNPELMKYLISLCQNSNAIICDFFAGSGTTGEAVIELNEEDHGNRKFILCTNNENNICDEITYPRIKNVIKNDDSKQNGLRYYTTDFVDYSGTKDQLYYDLTEKCIPMLCVKGDTYIPYITNEEYIIYTNENKSKYTCVYYDILGQKYNEFLEECKKIKEMKLLYIFNLGDSVNEEPLRKLINYVVEPIPYKIIELYKKVVKMSKGE